MSATDDKQPQSRRYRAEVKRARVSRRSGTDSGSSPKPPQTQTLPEQEQQTSDESLSPQAFAAEPAGGDVSGTEEYVDQTAVMPAEKFDYIVPNETFKQHSAHRHQPTHTGNTKTTSREEMEEAEAGYIFAMPVKQKKHRKRHRHHHGKFRRLPLWKRILIVIAAILLVLIIALAGSFFALKEIGRRNMHNYDNIDIVTPTEDESGNDIIRVDNSGRVITYDGISYELNKDLVSVVFIGTDDGTGAENGDITGDLDEEDLHLRMADAIYIFTLDTKTGAVKILSVSRDTMTDVDLYSEQGRFIDTQRMQIAFSYAYGNDTVTGGKNTNTSLTRLFYGLPFENYFAINMNALVTLNDTIGGVTLTSSMTFTSPVDGRTINAGETVTLHGEEADYYVRLRDKEQLDSNNDRMQRQQEYIRAFLSSIVPAAKNDISVVTNLYNEIQANTDTTLDLPKMTYIASTALAKMNSAADIEYMNLAGEFTEGEFAELNVSNEDAIRTMLDVFYTPLADIPENIQQ